LGAEIVGGGRKVLCHCLMGFNRSALVAGLILVHLGMSGPEALAMLRDRRPGALYNPVFAEYLASLPGRGHLVHADAVKHEIHMEE
jgi:protein-tyrosine phosphatase